MAGFPAFFMADIPVAICYLLLDGDERNKCLLYHNEFRIIKDGREHIYPTDNGIGFEFTHKKWMFPFVVGWILMCASLLFIFRNQFNPWISLTALILSVFAIYVGWEGSDILHVRAGSVTHSFPVKKTTSNLKLFVNFVNNYLSQKQGSEPLLIFHMTTQNEWQRQVDEHLYSHPSLKTEGFIHCSQYHQVIGTYHKHLEGISNLVLLSINPLKLSSALKLEMGKDQDQLFPHIYGTINKEAIVTYQEFGSTADLRELLKK